MMDFARACLPWVLFGLSVALTASVYRDEDSKVDRADMTRSMMIGMLIGTSLSLLVDTLDMTLCMSAGMLFGTAFSVFKAK
ncbi:MAG: hypothetical protein IJD03_05535 [Clostridia bacterium]|nr:hypothetical protein [Clostridia bacterium]